MPRRLVVAHCPTSRVAAQQDADGYLPVTPVSFGAMASGLGWREVADPAAVEADVDEGALAAARLLGGTVAATLLA